MYVVGGAAIALAFDERRATRDIDAVFEPKNVVYEAAEVVAEQLGLPGGWLNDAVKGFLEGDDPAARFFVEQVFSAEWSSPGKRGGDLSCDREEWVCQTEGRR